MNAGAISEQLEGIIGRAASVMVATVQISEAYPMTAGLVRQRLAAAKAVEVHEEGVAVKQSDGSWLWVAMAQPGGHRA